MVQPPIATDVLQAFVHRMMLKVLTFVVNQIIAILLNCPVLILVAQGIQLMEPLMLMVVLHARWVSVFFNFFTSIKKKSLSYF